MPAFRGISFVAMAKGESLSLDDGKIVELAGSGEFKGKLPARLR